MIVNLGLPKSGTTTLAEALRSAGLRVADHKIRYRDTTRKALRGTFVARQLYDGYFRQGDPLAALSPFDALAEISVLKPDMSLWPQTDFGLLQTLRDVRPDTRFVLTLRPAEEIADSMMRWGNMGLSRMPRLQIPGLPAGYGAGRLDLVRFVEGHHAFVRRLFDGDPNFLPLDIPAPDAPDRLAAFLGRAVPWWGRANANPPEA
ncbi:MAG: sulfotransferase family protein [Roseivivax sp.]|nr:sulfotransferase family protein [Roseivivax sp.]